VQAIKKSEFIPKFIEMDPFKTLEELASHFDPKVSSGQELTVDLVKDNEHPPPEKICFDPLRFKQSIFLVLTNAFKYTKDKKGEV